MDNSNLEIRLEVYIRQSNYSGSGLQIQESFTIPTASFTEMAKILGQFHDLAERIHAEKTR